MYLFIVFNILIEFLFSSTCMIYEVSWPLFHAFRYDVIHFTIRVLCTRLLRIVPVQCTHLIEGVVVGDKRCVFRALLDLK